MPQTSQSGKAFKGRGADAPDEGAQAAVETEVELEKEVEVAAALVDVDDGLLAAPAIFSPLFFDMEVVRGCYERASKNRG